MSKLTLQLEHLLKDYVRQYMEKVELGLNDLSIPLTHAVETHQGNVFTYTFYHNQTPVMASIVEFTDAGIEFNIHLYKGITNESKS